VNGKVEEMARTRLSRELICERALEIIDEVGLQALSMRMLAAALGVKASSLYHHFASRDELMTGVAEFLYHQLGRPPEGGDWAEQVKSMFVQLLDFIETHPNAAPLLIRDLAFSEVAEQRANAVMGLASRVGLDRVTSAALLGNLVALLVGHTLLLPWSLDENMGTAVSDADNDMHAHANERPPTWLRKMFPEVLGPEPSDTGISPSFDVFAQGLDALLRGFIPDAS
jgi:AcrR family transcriptional regulator